ncbi:hypothetical protein PV646_28690 [Streptomyces sp. ID05-26A]|nr:hypothetical protein [Streptomyces sp. ID05-26A]
MYEPDAKDPTFRAAVIDVLDTTVPQVLTLARATIAVELRQAGHAAAADYLDRTNHP